MDHQRKLRRVIEDFNDKTFLYAILLNKSHSYYGKLKTLYKIPIIITSSILSIVNSTNFDDEVAVKYVNVSFNLLTAMILSLGSTLNLEEKYSNFLNCEKKMLKLSSLIEQKILEEEILETEFVKNITSQYEGIVELIEYEIPLFIQRKVHNEYKGKKTLPLICNGFAKREEERSPYTRSITYMNLREAEKNSNVLGSNYGVLDVKSKIIYKDILEDNHMNKQNISPIIRPNSSIEYCNIPIIHQQTPKVLPLKSHVVSPMDCINECV